jgi:hypothetical protein
MTKTLCPWILSAAMALSVPALAASQETPAVPTQQGDSIPRLELARDPRIEYGRVAAVHGTVGPEGLRFVVGDLSILQPVVVVLLARDETDDLTASLFKKDWTNVRRTASTRGRGSARFEFRTQGGVNILLRGDSTETPFALVVWAGGELRPSMPDVVVTYEEFRKRNPAAYRNLGSPSADGHRSPRTSATVWIVLALVGAGAAAFASLRALGRRNQV